MTCRFKDDPTHWCRRNTGQLIRPGEDAECWYEAAADMRDHGEMGRKVNAIFEMAKGEHR